MRTRVPHIGSGPLPIGLDLGRTAVRAVQLQPSGGRWRLLAAWELPWMLPETGPDGHAGEPDEARLQEALRRLQQHGPCKGAEAIAHCPSDRLDMRPIELPAGREGLPREAVLGALRLQLGSVLPFPAAQAVFDYFGVGRDGRSGKLKVMAVTADGQWIRRRIALVESCGWHCRRLDALPCALARVAAWAEAESPDESGHVTEPAGEDGQGPYALSAILDIGYEGSTLVVKTPHGAEFCRRFGLGGREMTEILSQRLMMGFDRAERFKRMYGMDLHSRRLCTAAAAADGAGAAASAGPTGSDRTDGIGRAPSPESSQQSEIGKTIFAALHGELQDYLEALTRSLNYVITNHPQGRLHKIYLAGSAAHLRNLDVFMTEQFGLPVERLHTELLDEIVSGLPASRAQAGGWVTALGLALAGGQRT
ncbi:MAG: pilus assembly protein PilM [Sedimentisphaerales bacterium]|nr:pilus assembly protein PilM [Sedimentisphaerales bacterium]